MSSPDELMLPIFTHKNNHQKKFICEIEDFTVEETETSPTPFSIIVLDKFRASQKKPGKSKLLRKQRNCPIPLI
jgi:hypothetical protein